MEPVAMASLTDYDVFLSFRGPDTRQGLTDVLYDHMVRAGIRAFKDDDELMIGDKIETIFQAIANSELCVPIFSQTFASSKWCLDEVERMVRLKKNIAPIFYQVSPNDVKLKTPTYNNYMVEHEIKYGEERVEKWKDAIRAATGFKGREVLNKSYTEFCKEFISQVLKTLKPREKFPADDLIGVEKQLEDFAKLSATESAGVRYIGIHGMGGIGKTALAKVIFNKCSASFNRCSFIEDVRERSSQPNGLKNLQEELRSNLDPTYKEVSNSLRDLSTRFSRKKVLIVLDDVDNRKQITQLVGKSCWFGPGSRIIVTTRDITVLTKCGALNREEVFPFKMAMLELHDALQLFSRYAFQKDSPPTEFRSLSEEVVSTTGKLPLALIVIGSFLRNEEKEVWEDIIARSGKVPIKEVKDTLKISYDKLERGERQIFLDIACLPICKEKSKVIHMWKASDFFPAYGLAVLQSMSLIKIEENNRIWMHDQLRDLGRDIVRSESEHSRKRSRLWEHDEALEVLTRKRRRKESVQALCLDTHSKVVLTRGELDTFDSLRLLQLGEAKFEGDLDRLLPQLRWLSWRSRSKFKACSFSLANLVTLDLSTSSITENWRGWSLLQGAKNLKDLTLSRCLRLRRTPDFPEHMILERLVLLGCLKLASIHSSIGNLKCLKHLNLYSCSRLVVLPKEIRKLKALVELELAFTQIVRLPKSVGAMVELEKLSLSCSAVARVSRGIGALTSLVSLKLSGSRLDRLPSSIGGLVKLEILLLDCTKIKELPDTLGELKSLVNLDVQATRITELPDCIGELTKLERLALSHCSALEVLNESIGNLKSLIELHLSRTAITELPDSIGGLENLKEFRIDGCKLIKFPRWFGKLRKLEELHAGSNQSLGGLPRKVTRLSCLRTLDVHGSSILKMPSSISRLSLLETLNVENCHRLRKLPELPTSLTQLFITSKSLQRVPDLSEMTNLVHLKLGGGNNIATCNLDAIVTLFKLKSLELRLGLARLADSACLPANFSRLTRLQSLVLSCRNMKHPLQLPSSLSSLVLQHVDSQTDLPCLSNLVSLEELQLEEWSKNNGYGILGIGDLHSLAELKVEKGSFDLMDGLRLPQNLRILGVYDCAFLRKSPDLSASRSLQDLTFSNCRMLTEIPGLGKMESLLDLIIKDCNSLEKVESLSELGRLEHLEIINCEALKHVEGLDSSRLAHYYCGRSEDQSQEDEDDEAEWE